MAESFALPLLVVGGLLICVIPLGYMAHRRRRERLMREACVDILSGYMAMDDGNGQLEVPLYRNHMPQFQ